MKRATVMGLVSSLFLIGLTSMVSAGQLNSRDELDLLLGTNQIFEDFESVSFSYGNQHEIDGPLNSTTTFAGQGPGLVEVGATYQSDGGHGLLWWNGDGYFDLNTKTLGDSSEWRDRGIEIIYTSPVDAIGFNMQNYVGYSMEGTVSVYDTEGGLLSTTNVNGGFWGWENIAGGGIGSAFIAADDQNYIMIDNHGYGSAIPEPATLSLLALGGLLLRKRK